ncbi:hypothetical protein MASR2M70_05240 [Bacillota bacterium]
MKQIIVMIAMIGLGIAIAGFVMGFNSTAADLATAAKSKISYDLVTKNP